jgi:hypothetical protein
MTRSLVSNAITQEICCTSRSFWYLLLEQHPAAEHHAARTAAEIGRDQLPTSDAREIIVEVRNEHKQRLVTVKVSMRILRVAPPPEPPYVEGSPPDPWTS